MQITLRLAECEMVYFKKHIENILRHKKHMLFDCKVCSVLRYAAEPRAKYEQDE